MKLNDLTGKKFGRLTALNRATNSNTGEVRWDCVCDCGEQKTVFSDALVSGNTKSCGCLNVDMVKDRSTTHGKRQSAEYRVWCHMKGRCITDTDTSFLNYGGRGIKVCDRWLHSFENFYADMGQRPTAQHSIDRIDNDGDYTPENCRWATPKEQANNKRKRKSKTGISGVCKHSKNSWKAYITVNGKTKRLKNTMDFFEAVCARKSAENKIPDYSGS